GYSVVAVLAPTVLPQGADHVYFEASAVIITLVLVGRYLEGRARGRAGAAVQTLLGQQPSQAIRLSDGEQSSREETVPITAITVGDCLRVRDGDQIPLDGRIEDGAGDIDESMITGEALPVPRRQGDAVVGGTVLTTGSLIIRVEAVGADTAVARIAAMVAQAQAGKLPIQSLVDRVTAVFVPVVLVIAAVTAVLWYVVGPDPALSNAMVSAVAVLIIACPCAMGLAVPTSIMVATGLAAQKGILFARGDALQTLCSIRLLACDKTGTLTHGSMAIESIHGLSPERQEQVLSMAAAVEQHSSHPIAHALCSYVRDRDWPIAHAEDYQVRHGAGVQARVADSSGGWRQVQLLSHGAASAGDYDLKPWEAAVQAVIDAAASPLVVIIDGQVEAVLGISDQVRAEAAEALTSLRQRGVRTVMLSGDHHHQAQTVAQAVGIEEVFAPLRPEEKVATLEQLRDEGLTVASIGDGVNDAPLLAQADIGIAIGAGTDIAIEAADVVLMADDLRRVALAMDISVATMRTIRQNVFWAFAYNTALIPVAAGALYPVWGITLNPAFAALAMAASSICVVANALRLKQRVAGMARPSPTSG
ncbi:MAG: heavy metal translocating P-type ATPase, partial [Planctomycetota bacterium]